MKWIDVGEADKIPDNTMAEIDAGTSAIVLVKSEGEFFAVAAICPHHSAWFIQGWVEGSKLHCPRHMGVFDMKTGCLLSGPTCPALPIYATKFEDGHIFVGERLASMSKKSGD